MDDMQIQEINRYCSPYSLLVITPKKLMRLHCPFTVQVIIPVGLLELDQFVKVQQVKITKAKELLYLIDLKAYYYYHFSIIV
jgi:hypothetical protein